MVDKKEPEIPASTLTKMRDVIQKKTGDGTNRRIPMTWDEIMQQRQEAIAMRMQEKMLKDDFDAGPKEGESNDQFMDRMINYAMKYQFAMNMPAMFAPTKKKDDDESPTVKLLQQQLDEMKRESQERKRRDEIQEMLEPLKEELKELKSQPKKSADEDSAIKVLEKQITDLTTKLTQKEQDQKHEELMNRLDDISEKYNDLQASYEKLKSDPPKNDIDSFIENSKKIENKKRELARLLGLSEKEAEDISVPEMIKQGVDLMGPIGDGVRTIREAFVDKEETPDIPPNYNEPIRNLPPPNTQTIDPRIEAFLSRCTEKNGQLIDPEGVPWTTTDGKPISKAMIRDISMYDPKTVLERIQSIPPDVMSRPRPPPKKRETARHDETNKETEEEQKKEEPEEESRSADEEEKDDIPNPKPEEKKSIELTDDSIDAMNDDDAQKVASEYIQSMMKGKLTDGDHVGDEALVGPKNEYYFDQNTNKPITDPNVLMESAKDNPKDFLKTVRAAQAQSESVSKNGKEEGN